MNASLQNLPVVARYGESGLNPLLVFGKMIFDPKEIMLINSLGRLQGYSLEVILWL